jgi:hypothetical protein
MRISQPLSLQGYFWLTTRPEQRLPGTLTVSEIGRVDLEVLGVFGDVPEFEPKATPVIHGLTGNGKLVTLAECLTYATTLSFPGIPKSRATAARLFVGVHFSEIHTLAFDRVTFSVDGLDEWIGLAGITVSHDWDGRKLKVVTITYRPPAAQSHQIGDRFDLCVQCRSSIPTGTGTVKEAKVTQATSLEINAPEPKPLDELLRIVHRINTFLCLAMDEPVALTALSLSSSAVTEQVGDKERPVEINLYFPSLPHPEKAPTVERHKLLFPYGVVAESLGDLLSRWLADYETLEPAFNLYFASTTAHHAYLETRFLFLTQGLETFHRRTTTDTVMPKAHFQAVRASLLSACPQQHVEWLKTRLAYANELSLRQRLKALIEPIGEYFGKAAGVSGLINQLVATRNYLTHYDKTSHKTALSGEALLHLAMKLEAIFILIFLGRIGVSNDQLRQIAQGNSRMARKIRGEV